jgi:hypothetical protein
MRLWRYMDLPKFVELLTSQQLWLTNLEVLATDDPYEGLPGPIQFPHRAWQTIDEVPEVLRRQIVQIYGKNPDSPPAAAFRFWLMLEEQRCIMNQAGRRDFFVNCWHAADHESAAMWKIYGGPGAGVALVTNGRRLETALSSETRELHLGAVQYRDPNIFMIGMGNAFDSLIIKRSSYAYEQEVRLVYWNTGSFHDALAEATWNDETMRYEGLLDDDRPILPGISFGCDLDALIERVIISPSAPQWYLPMIERLRDRLGCRFPVLASRLLSPPLAIP